jgi:hypothetical protein
LYDNDSIVGKVKAFTARAVLIALDGGKEHWVPRSQIEEEPNDEYLTSLRDDGIEAEFTIPGWLSEKIANGE